jgi:hypothetical protein
MLYYLALLLYKAAEKQDGSARAKRQPHGLPVTHSAWPFRSFSVSFWAFPRTVASHLPVTPVNRLEMVAFWSKVISYVQLDRSISPYPV